MSTQPRPTSATAPPVHPTRPADPARPADAGRTVPPADTAPAPGTAGPRRATRVPPAAPGTRPLPPLTLALDPADTPACTRTALAAHDPARGQATVHPTPGTAHTADLAHDVMAALGKPDAAPSPWTTRPTLTWAAAAAHARAMRLGHLIVLRAHLLTPARLHQLLLFQQRTGAHLTLVCHRAPTPALTRALAHVGHSVTHGLPPYAHPPHPPRAATTVGAGTLPPRPATPTWLTLPALTRLAWPHTPTPCDCSPPPPHPDHTPFPTPPGRLEETLTRLARLSHPTHAAALATALFTGAPYAHLSTLTPPHCHPTRPTLHLHKPAHHHTPARCAAHPIPAWARPFLHTATLYHHYLTRTPTSPFTSWRTEPATDLADLLHTAEHCRLRPPQDPWGRPGGRFRLHFPQALPDGPEWTIGVWLDNLPPDLQTAALR